MATTTNSQTDAKATVWLKPEQVEKLRSATVENSAGYLTGRNDAIIATLYDTGLRVSELVALKMDMLDLSDAVVAIPPEIQKDYPNDNSPEYTRISLKDGTVRTLRMFLGNRWKDSPYLFPTRQSDQIGTESVRGVVRQAAVDADVRPYTLRGRGDPGDVTPHALRHSVAYRMIAVEGETLYRVTKRLRHSSIQTTERVYAHFDEV